jgi:hypothetical protein
MLFAASLVNKTNTKPYRKTERRRMTFRELLRNGMLPLLAVLCILGNSSPTFAQANIEAFGQNRIQYRKFDWKYFDTKHFRVYHYDKSGRQLGRHVAEEAEYDMNVIERRLGSQFPQRFNIILYNNYDEYRQSNIGLKEESSSTLGNTKAGSLKIVDDKLVVYFTGAHADIRRQIRSGMATVVMQRMLYGDNLKKAVKNSLVQNLPEWVTAGYIAYLVDGWDEKTNSEWKGLMNANPNRGFYEISMQQPEIAGKAFWKFVSDQYGPNTVKTLLYAMQQKASLNKATLMPQNLNMKVTKAYDSCMKYYKSAYAVDELNQEKPDSTHGVAELKVPSDNTILRNIKISPDGVNVAFVAWKNGQFNVMIQRAGNDEAVPISLLEGGQKDLTEEIDPSYPMLAWSKTGSKLAILYRLKRGTYLRIYNHTKGRIENYTIPNNRFERAISMSFTEDDGALVLSAVKKSQTDLYLFTIKGSKLINITDDAWDDLSPQFISGGSRTGILFLSNRPKPNMNVPVGVNELPSGPLNVFFYNIVSKNPELIQCTNVQKGRISQPIQYGFENFAYLHDSNGINNKYVVMFKRNAANKDSAYSLPVTNYTTSILSHQFCPATGYVADVIQPKTKYVTYFHDLVMPDPEHPKKLVPTKLSLETQDAPQGSSVKIATDGPVKKKAAKKQPAKVEVPRSNIKGGNTFQSEFTDNEEKNTTKNDTTNLAEATSPEEDATLVTSANDSSTLTEINDSAYVKMKPSKYRFSFKPDFLSIKLDNTILFNQYQSIQSNGGEYDVTLPSALANISLDEVMENHKLQAGFQFPLAGGSPTSTYFVQYQNLTHRLDWGFLYLYKYNKDQKAVSYYDVQGTYIGIAPQIIRNSVNMAQIDFSYPLDRLRSIKFHTGVREDRLSQKIVDSLSLFIDFKKTASYTSVSRLEFIFDNTTMPAMNILLGTRAKVYTEYMYGLNDGNKSCYNIGFDFRNYQKLYKNLIWANRFAYAHSDGNKIVQYGVGGVDNPYPKQIGEKYGQVPSSIYGFQMMATSLRGYGMFHRIGNNFAVVNSEVRLPLVTTFAKRPIQSSVIKNLQLVAFVDVGTAWNGFIPNAKGLSDSVSTATNTNLRPSTSPYYQLQVPGLLPPKGNTSMQIVVPLAFEPIAGYGLGLRTFIGGYFIRLDYARKTEYNLNEKKYMIHIGLGTDF